MHEVEEYLREAGSCTCAVVKAYQREWEIKAGRVDCYVPMGIRCTVHFGVVPSDDGPTETAEG